MKTNILADFQNCINVPLRTSPVAASGKIRTNSPKLAKFQFHFQFLLFLISWAPSRLRHNSCRTRYPQKILVVVSIPIAIQTSKNLN